MPSLRGVRVRAREKSKALTHAERRLANSGLYLTGSDDPALPSWWPTEAELIAATEAELERITRSTSNKGQANKCQHDLSH